jgi:8-oxo-dGTP diphosphatase
MGAVAVTVDGEGRLLIGQRTDDGLWDFPGGYMNLGENVAHTAVRETHEETGLWVVPERILGIFSPTIPWVYPNGDRIQSVVTLFRCRPSGGELQADRVETSRVAWMKPEEILAFDTHPSLARLNHEILTHLDEGYFIQIS